MLGPLRGGSSHGRGIHCTPFYNEKRVCARWFLKGSLIILMGSCVRYRLCHYFPFRRISISIPFPWILQISGPLQGISSFPIKGICRLSRFELCPSLKKGESLYHSSIFLKWTGGLGCPKPFSLSAENMLTNT